jgi:hypothetical protein
MKPEDDCLELFESSPREDSSRCLSVELLTGELRESCDPPLNGEELDKNEGVPADTLDISEAESYTKKVKYLMSYISVNLRNEVSLSQHH